MRNPSVGSRSSREAGQGMTEYIIIVALIAIAAIGVYSFFGQTASQDPSGKAVAKDSVPAKPAKSDPKGVPEPKSAVVTK